MEIYAPSRFPKNWIRGVLYRKARILRWGEPEEVFSIFNPTLGEPNEEMTNRDSSTGECSQETEGVDGAKKEHLSR